jgi:hypothetical protein
MPIQSLQKRRAYQWCPSLRDDDVNRNFQVANDDGCSEQEKGLDATVSKFQWD